MRWEDENGSDCFGGRLWNKIGTYCVRCSKTHGTSVRASFLEYILRDLSSKGITRVILAVGYKADCIEQFFKDRFEGMELVYSLEEKPLFTGGAVKWR